MNATPPRTPKEAIEEAIREIASRLSLVEGTSPSSHTVVVSSGLDDRVVAESLALYAVAFLAGWVERDAKIGERFAVHGYENRDEVRKIVELIVLPPPDLTGDQLANWRITSRDPWLAEVLTHAIFVIRRGVPSASLVGDVVAVLRPHPSPKRQGLDSVAIYQDGALAVVAVGETKASCSHGSDELTHACDMFDNVDDGLYGPDLRNALDLLASVLPAELANQLGDSLWRNQRCYVPAIVHETEFDASRERPRLARLEPPAERKRVLVLRMQDFDTFFDAVATLMPELVDRIVV
jgi:hypothetical protein